MQAHAFGNRGERIDAGTSGLAGEKQNERKVGDKYKQQNTKTDHKRQVGCNQRVLVRKDNSDENKGDVWMKKKTDSKKDNENYEQWNSRDRGVVAWSSPEGTSVYPRRLYGMHLQQ